VKSFLLNTLFYLIALFLGAWVNGYLIQISSKVITPPVGYDLQTAEGLKAAINAGVMTPRFFIFPFLAHALGTWVSAFTITKLTRTHQKERALSFGFLFLTGGTWMVFIIPAPLWFNAVDLLLAYIPMAYMGYLMARKKKSKSSHV
jgi:hypothetical protein